MKRTRNIGLKAIVLGFGMGLIGCPDSSKIENTAGSVANPDYKPRIEQRAVYNPSSGQERSADDGNVPEPLPEPSRELLLELYGGFLEACKEGRPEDFGNFLEPKFTAESAEKYRKETKGLSKEKIREMVINGDLSQMPKIYSSPNYPLEGRLTIITTLNGKQEYRLTGKIF